MDIFRTITLRWWEVGALKLAVAAVGIVIGAYFSEEVKPYTWPLLGLYVVLCIYLVTIWIRRK